VGTDRTGPHSDREQTERLTVAEAADALGISAEAVRMRVRRGTLRTERVEGTVYVLLDRRRHDRTRPHADATSDRTSGRDELVSQLRDEIVYLREENRRKDHLLAAALERIPPALEAPQSAPAEARESPVSPGPADTPPSYLRDHHSEPQATERPEEEPRPAAGGEYAVTEEPHAQEEEPQGEARRSWWGRIFGY
jgi:hypothetical protein